ncbi:MAG: Arc family DNA-binding protein [Egibacteraceae bacterium]
MAFTLRLPDDLNEELRHTAEQEGRSMQSVAVAAISDYLRRKQLDHVRGVARRIATRDRALLERLGDA